MLAASSSVSQLRAPGAFVGDGDGCGVGVDVGLCEGAEDGLGAGDGSVGLNFSEFEVDELGSVIPRATPIATATSTTMAILQRVVCFIVTLMQTKPFGAAFCCWP